MQAGDPSTETTSSLPADICTNCWLDPGQTPSSSQASPYYQIMSVTTTHDEGNRRLRITSQNKPVETDPPQQVVLCKSIRTVHSRSPHFTLLVQPQGPKRKCVFALHQNFLQRSQAKGYSASLDQTCRTTSKHPRHSWTQLLTPIQWMPPEP